MVCCAMCEYVYYHVSFGGGGGYWHVRNEPWFVCPMCEYVYYHVSFGGGGHVYYHTEDLQMLQDSSSTG